MQQTFQVIFFCQEEIVRTFLQYEEDVTALLSFIDYGSFDAFQVLRLKELDDRGEWVEVTEDFFVGA